MIDLAKYTPVVEDIPGDDENIRLFSYEPNEYDYAINDYLKTEDEAFAKPEVVELMNKDVQDRSRYGTMNGFIFTPDMLSQLSLSMKSNSRGSTPKMDKSTWVKKMTEAYRKAGIKNDNAIKVLITQDGLESGWGRSAQGRYNYGNITTGSKWKGDYIQGNDTDANGRPIKQKFRSYQSMEDYAKDKVQFLKNLYDFNEVDDITTFARKMKGGNSRGLNYAEDRRYAEKLIATYRNLKL